MGEISQLHNFWASILRETVTDELKSTLAITDVEEKAIQLLSRVLFLLVMEIKHERDAVQEKYQNLLKDIGSTNDAQANNKKLEIESGGGSSVEKAVGSSKPGFENEEDEVVNSSIGVEEPFVNISSKTDLNSKKTENTGHNLKMIRNTSPPTENINSKNLSSTSRKLVVDILFPGNRNDCYVAETMALGKEDSEPHMEMMNKEHISVPETMAMVPDKYGNTDFFEENSSIVPYDDAYDVVDSFTPTKEPPKQAGDTPLLCDTSPVLGKMKRSDHLESPNVRRFNIDGKKKSSPRMSKNKVPDFSTPGKVQETNVNLTSRYSPLNFTASPVIPSPSLLTNCVTEKNDAEKECKSPISPSIISLAVLNSNKAKKKMGTILDRSASVMAAGPSGEVKKSMKRISSCLEERKSYEITVYPTDSKRKCRYKQTKITDLPCETEVASLDKDLKKAIEESLKSKTAEDLMRKKNESLQLELKQDPSLKDDKWINCRSPAKRSTLDAQNRNGSPQKFMKSPKKLQRSPQNLLRSPLKRAKSPQKLLRSPCKLVKSPCKKQSSPVSTPEKDTNQKLKTKKKSLKAEKESTLNESSILNTEELIKNINGSPPTAEPKPTKRLSKTLQRKQNSRNQSKKSKSKPLQDSFDLLPKPDSVGFAYQNDPVRKKAERQQLPGWKCHECKEWYEGEDLTNSEKRRLINKCSRHRAKYNPVTNTPEGFWKPDWDDDD